MEHQDEHITCAECGTTFVFTAAEAESFASKRLEPPKRCLECRKARRAQRNGGRQEGAPRGQFGGDVNGYRAPMSDPSAGRGRGEYRAPGFRDSNPSGGYGGREGGFRGGRGGGGGGGRGEYRAPSFGGDQGPRGGGEYRAPSFGGDRGGRPGGRGGPGGGFRGGPPRSDFGGAPRGPQSGARDRGPQGAGPGAQGERGPRRSHGERPSYPITCAQCGAASEVPFKPQEGREILCRDCYRAKKEAG